MEVVQLDDPLEAGLQVAILFEHPVLLGADGPLDSDDLATSRTVGFRSGGGAGCCRCVGPVLEYRQGPLQLPHGADDGHDLDGSAALPQRFPKAAMRFAPGAERGRGIVSGIDVDEEGALGVQRDRQFGREAGIRLRKYLWDKDLATRCGLRVSHGVSEGRKSRYPLGLREKHAETERSGGSAAARSRAEDVA